MHLRDAFLPHCFRFFHFGNFFLAQRFGFLRFRDAFLPYSLRFRYSSVVAFCACDTFLSHSLGSFLSGDAFLSLGFRFLTFGLDSCRISEVTLFDGFCLQRIHDPRNNDGSNKSDRCHSNDNAFELGSPLLLGVAFTLGCIDLIREREVSRILAIKQRLAEIKVAFVQCARGVSQLGFGDSVFGSCVAVPQVVRFFEPKDSP